MAFAILLWPLTSHAASFTIPTMKADAAAAPITTSTIASAVLIDVKSGTVLYAYEPGKTWTAASLTKLMTSHVFTTTPTKWDANASILKADEVGGGRLQVASGSAISFRDLLYSALIGSANNAAEALGRLFDRRIGKAGFIKLMNDEAEKLGLAQTSYYDASGMNEKNTLSAYDTAVLISETAEDPEAARAMSLATYSFTVRKPVLSKTLTNTNKLISSEDDLVFTAGKTGFLYESEYNFVAQAYPKGRPEKELVVVVLGGKDRDASQKDALSLMRWAWDSYAWTVSSSEVSLARNRGVGDKGEDVKVLQQYLNTHGFPIATSGSGSPGKETTLFGALTKAALIRYQEAHADVILTPHKAVKGSGYLDYYTRFAMHSGI